MTAPARRYTLDGRLGALIVRGARLKADVAEAVTKAKLDLSTSEVTQLDLKLYDPDLKLLDSRLFLPGSAGTAGTAIDYGPLRLECRAVAVEEGGLISVTARELGAYKLKRLKATPRRNMSPTRAAQLDALAVGLKFVGEPSPVVPTVPGEEEANAWEAHGKAADELGFLRFVVAGVYYYARPSWLVQRAGFDRVQVPWRGERTDPRLAARPACRRSGDDDNDAHFTAKLLGRYGDDVLPGAVAQLTGVPTFDGLYLVNGVAIELDDYSPVTITADSPRNPTPRPPQVDTPDGSGRAPQDTPVDASGSGTADAMVRYALGQAGTRYVYGAEASASDADPDAFDCSELVEWACARAGVRFVDGSSNQIARCRPISVAQGIRTRGALLWHPGHIAISLGDGRTIEASNRRYPVRTISAGGRFRKAGLIPGLRY